MKSQIHIRLFVTEHLKLCISCEEHFFSCASSFVHLVKIPGVLKKAEAPAGLCSQQGEVPFGGLEVNTLPPPPPTIPVILNRLHSLCTQTNSLTWPASLTPGQEEDHIWLLILEH